VSELSGKDGNSKILPRIFGIFVPGKYSAGWDIWLAFKINLPEYFLDIRLPCDLRVKDGAPHYLPHTPVALAPGERDEPAILFQNSSQLDCVFPVGTDGMWGVLIDLF
jgi:hypothetical protein